jgi:glucose-6-phosphate dehydrogenase assembly protein OpcA
VSAPRVAVRGVAGVEAGLAELWRQASTAGQNVYRACTVNLVVVCADGARDREEATRLVLGVSETAPGRAVVIAAAEAAPGDGSLEPYVSAHCHRGPNGAEICSEQVILEARGAGRGLVAGTVLQLLVEEMPVYTLWRRPGLATDPLLAPLLELSDRFIVDGARYARPRTFLRELHAVAAARGGTAVDLTWARLDPWREALASLFDPPAALAALERITACDVAAGGPAEEDGLTVAGGYVAGWLASRLGWERCPRGWRLHGGPVVRPRFLTAAEAPPGEPDSARIEALGDDTELAYVAQRTGDERDLVRLFTEEAGRCALSRLLRLPRRGEAALLCGALQHVEPDPVFEAALHEAASL